MENLNMSWFVIVPKKRYIKKQDLWTFHFGGLVQKFGLWITASKSVDTIEQFSKLFLVLNGNAKPLKVSEYKNYSIGNSLFWTYEKNFLPSSRHSVDVLMQSMTPQWRCGHQRLDDLHSVLLRPGCPQNRHCWRNVRQHFWTTNRSSL